MNQLFHGDCLDILPTIESNSCDLVIADLPYSSSTLDWDKDVPLDLLWEQFRRICKETSTVVMFGSQPFTSKIVMSNPSKFLHEWIWEKDKGANFFHVKRSPFKEHENIVVFRPNAKTQYFPTMEERRGNGKNCIGNEYVPNKGEKEGILGGWIKEGKASITTELRYPRSIQRFNRASGFHVTQKPEKLIEYLIKTYSREGDLVLDPTAGSCTTAIAAINTGRRWICIERDADIYERGRERINAAIK